ncbi:MAG TPA: hypothetical protein VNT22_01245 [Baekduia sp.]|nr:hypothetical protein [Baekduia sp.]
MRDRPSNEEITQEAVQERLDRLSSMFGTMMDSYSVQTQRRCPYKNKHGRCTAIFGCRNQRKPAVKGDLALCGGDDKINYASAWED